jgi:NAD(P)-dependent dehydrogenase (short-subunit alcohol dehydrogenase family)
MDKPFIGRSALVVGGSGGLGSWVCRALGEAGASVVVHGGSSIERLDRTVAAVRAAGGEARGFLLPIDSPRAAEFLLRELPRPDILVCAWGPFSRKALSELTADDWERAALLDLALPGVLVSSTLPDMIERRWGRILLFGGTNTDTIRGFSTTVAYSAAKTALGVLVKSVAKTAGKFGVTCNLICPGLADTEYLDEPSRAYARERAPGGRLVQGAEIAAAAYAIIANPSINGTIVGVDDGLSI